MAAFRAQQLFFFLLLLFSNSRVDGKLKCENISVASLSREFSLTLKPPNNTREKSIAVCINGDEAISLYRIWGSVQVAFDFDTTDAQYHEASSCADLQPANQSLTSLFQSYVLGSNTLEQTVFYFSSFKTSCLRLKPVKRQEVKISADFKVIDWKFPAAFLLGLIIFYNADRLSRNSVFFYSSGVTLGVLLALLLFVYVLHRVIPKRGAYVILLGGWSLVAFIIQWAVSNFNDLLLNNNQWVIGYILVAGVISFSVCYYYGPVTSGRGLDLIRWALQIVGLTLLYMGTRSEEVSLAVVVTVLIEYFIRNSGFIPGLVQMLPRQWVSYRLYYFFFPPKHKFLSEEEYVVEASEETSKALEELRQHCDSPDCNAWRVISRLKHPSRFASFVSGGEHILDEEMRDYEDDPAPVTRSDIEDHLNDSSDGR